MSESEKLPRALLWAIQELISSMISPDFKPVAESPQQIEKLMNHLRDAEKLLRNKFSYGDDVTASDIDFYSPPGNTPFETELNLVFYLAASIQERPYDPVNHDAEVWGIGLKMRMALEDFWAEEESC